MGVIRTLKSVSNAKSSTALPTRLRRKRFHLFTDMVQKLETRPAQAITVVDFGGTSAYWDQVYDMDSNPLRLDVTLVNLAVPQPADPRFRYVEADVRSLDWMQDRAFDVSFSNSLIEHLGDLSAQAQAVGHMKRVARLLYLQTPNRGFFWEPHYALPCVHWLSLPVRMRVLSLLNRTSLGDQYDAYIRNPVRLLSRSELRYLFPETQFDHRRERVLGMTKSYVVRSRVAVAGADNTGIYSD